MWSLYLKTKRSTELITITRKEIIKRDHFPYLGSIIHNSEKIREGVARRTKASQSKW